LARSDFKFILPSEPPPDLLKRLCGTRGFNGTPAEIPGVFVKRNVLFAPLNCAWILEDALTAAGVTFRVEPPKQRDRIRWSNVVEATRADLREWVTAFLCQYQKLGVVFALNAPDESGHLHHPTGCLTGDAELIVNRGGCARRMRLDDLVSKFNGGTTKHPTKKRDYVWDQRIPTMAQSAVDGFIRLNQITVAYASGEKEVFEITTKGGRRLQATGDHHFLTTLALEPKWNEDWYWRPLRDLVGGCQVAVAIDPGGCKLAKKSNYLQTQGVKHHPQASYVEIKRSAAWLKKRGYAAVNYVEKIWRVPTHRLVAEADVNGLTFEAYVARLRAGDIAGLTFLDEKLHVHHKDENTRNNALSNLEVLARIEHHRQHGENDGWQHVTARVIPDEIVRITPLGKKMTYDLSMADPHNNYVANSVVVHNSGKTLSGIVWATFRPGTIVVVTKASNRRGFQREFQRYTTIEPVVLTPASERRAKDLDPTQVIADAVARGEPPRAVIVGWETVPDFIDTLLTLSITSLVVDEEHKGQSHRRFAKIPQAMEGSGEEKPEFRRLDNIASNMSRLASNAQRRLGMTATAIPDRRRNLWAQLDLIHPWSFGRAWDFFYRYCDVAITQHGNRDNSGKSNTAELDRRLSFVCHHVDSAETRRELPPCRRQVLFITKAQQSPPSAFKKELVKAQKSGRSALREVRLAEAASRKRGVLLDYVKDAVLGGSTQKVVIFTGRHNDAERLEDSVRKACPSVKVWMAHGGHSTAIRDQIRDEFMAHPGPCALIGTGGAWGECFAPDTLVLGENKSIIDYARGDTVIGETGLVSCRGMKTKQFHGDMIEVRAQGLLPFTATPNHPVKVLAGGVTEGRDRHFVARGIGWKAIENVEPWNPSPHSPKNAHGDFVLVPRVPAKYANVKFDLREFVAREQDVAAREARGAPRYLKLDCDLAWVMGLYVAEGSASSRGGGQGWRAHFSLGAHERAVAERVQIILAARSIAATLNPLPKTNGLNVTVRSGPFARLMQAAMGKGAHNKCIPNEVLFNDDLDVLLSFLRGYVMGDGTTNGHRVQVSTVSKTLALQVQLAIARLGRFAGITPWRTKGGSIRGRPVKPSSYFIVTWRWENLRHERYKVYDDFIAVPVKSVRHVAYRGTVVDIGTTDRTFLASNAVVHNSYNLQDCDLAIFAQLPINGKELWQWEGRFTRHGQKRPVLILYPVAEGTIDEAVKAILLDKLEDVADLQKDSNFVGAVGDLVDSGLSEEDVMDRLFEKIVGDAA